MQQHNNSLEKNNLYNLKDYLVNLQENINNKEKELLNKQQYLLIKEQDLEEQEKLLNINDLKVQEEKLKYGEVLEDDILENMHEITNKHFSNSLKSIIKTIIFSILSFISGGITFILIKKWRLLHE